MWPCRLSVRDVSTGREQIYYPAADIDLSCKLSDLQPGTSYELKVRSAAKQLQTGPNPIAQSLVLSIFDLHLSVGLSTDTAVVLTPSPQHVFLLCCRCVPAMLWAPASGARPLLLTPASLLQGRQFMSQLL